MTTKSAIILLVEDDRSMLEGIRDLLTLVDIGYEVEVLTAGNGRAGLEVIQQQVPDLIISDIMMPEMDGFEFLNHVRQRAEWAHIPVIFLTAKGSKQDIHKGRTSGADLYITKPFNSREFLELVSSQLDRAFQLRLNRQQSLAGLKKNILQILNHEFRTPLTYVTAYYEMLADSMNQVQEDENLQEFLRGIQVGCVRLTHLVEDLIQVLDIRTGELKSRFTTNAHPINDLPQIVQEAISNLEASAPHFLVPIHYEPALHCPPVFGDEDALRQVFTRLLHNAVKFTYSRKRQKGHVYVTINVVDKQIRVAFSDQGVGFPPHVKERLFDLFFQYNREVLEQQGAGTGLTIAKALVEMHGGQIEAENLPDGEGSVFTVLLPVYEPGEKRGTLFREQQNKGAAKILVVEDDPHLLVGLQELLEIFEGPYTLSVQTASNGRIGLEVLARQKPDRIISDIMMPEMGGYEFLSKVRENSEWVQIPFIFLTAKGEREDIHRGRRSGAEEYITKPYDSDELLELVVTQLDRHFMVQGALHQDFEELKRSILQLITPDFRLPLSTVSEFSARLVSDMSDVQTDEDLKWSLFGIREGSKKLSRLVEDLITMAELETGEMATAYSLRAQPVRDAGLYLYEAGQMHHLAAERSGIEIKCQLNLEMPQVISDGVSLQTGLQRLIEMVVNYCRSAKYHGKLELRAVDAGNEVHLIVSAPVPMPEKDAAYFVSGQDTAVSPDVNTNIRILQGVIALHNGRIALQPTASGTDIIIALPVYRAA